MSEPEPTSSAVAAAGPHLWFLPRVSSERDAGVRHLLAHGDAAPARSCSCVHPVFPRAGDSTRATCRAASCHPVRPGSGRTGPGLSPAQHPSCWGWRRSDTLSLPPLGSAGGPQGPARRAAAGRVPGGSVLGCGTHMQLGNPDVGHWCPWGSGSVGGAEGGCFPALRGPGWRSLPWLLRCWP